jgi:methylmalonyl-CoA epimerase
VSGLAHIAIAAHDAEPLATTLVNAFGGRRGEEELLDGGALRVVFVHLGPVTVEILEPRSKDHTVAKFLESRGPGLHHVSLEMNDLDEALRRAKESGVRLIDESPRAGAHGSRVAFLHPKSLGGVLIELTQSRSEPS